MHSVSLTAELVLAPALSKQVFHYKSGFIDVYGGFNILPSLFWQNQLSHIWNVAGKSKYHCTKKAAGCYVFFNFLQSHYVKQISTFYWHQEMCKFILWSFQIGFFWKISFVKWIICVWSQNQTIGFVKVFSFELIKKA